MPLKRQANKIVRQRKGSRVDINFIGSVCSGIEAASVAWKPLGWRFCWFSEIADFPSRVLKKKYPEVKNLGDMNVIPEQMATGNIHCPDLICGGTPCQAFSLAGWKNGLNDNRGNLTLKFVDIVEENDRERIKAGLGRGLVFWENVEGVLTDKTNAFGCLVSSLAGLKDVIENSRWPNAGVVRGPKRNIAWRVIDAKFFGVPQQRRRLYLLAGDKDFFPENILFERHVRPLAQYPKQKLLFEKEGHSFEVFREYTDCLYSSYGTKWNGNAAAYNGSLFVVQDGRIRRLSPLECERLMGFDDNYANLAKAKKTNRYQAIGNSWAVPVVRWIGRRIVEYNNDSLALRPCEMPLFARARNLDDGVYLDFGKDVIQIHDGESINCTPTPEECHFKNLKDIIEVNLDEDIFISPVGCYGMIRRKRERNLRMNKRLEEVLLSISSKMSVKEIEKISRVQKRGRFSAEPGVITEGASLLAQQNCQAFEKADRQFLLF